jgi:hypothetical protein
MTPLFPRWSNWAVRLVAWTLLAVVVLVPTALMVYARTPYGLGTHYPVDQPVEFDHRHHVRDDGIDCRFCHTWVEVAATAGIPPTALCMGCHGQIWANSPLLAPVRRSYYSGEPIAWQRVHDVPDFVQFNHAIHVANGIGCESCHGRVDTMARVYKVEPLTMSWCLDCHRNPEPHLRPQEQITAMGWTQSSPEQGRQLARQYGTRRLVHCSACHR